MTARNEAMVWSSHARHWHAVYTLWQAFNFVGGIGVGSMKGMIPWHDGDAGQTWSLARLLSFSWDPAARAHASQQLEHAPTSRYLCPCLLLALSLPLPLPLPLPCPVFQVVQCCAQWARRAAHLAGQGKGRDRGLEACGLFRRCSSSSNIQQLQQSILNKWLC